MCLVESNQPVYPLDIVRQMRDQRAMLIQTSVSNTFCLKYLLSASFYSDITFIKHLFKNSFQSQYKFVCEAILRVYNGKCQQTQCFIYFT